jgi:hypothetical protein
VSEQLARVGHRAIGETVFYPPGVLASEHPEKFSLARVAVELAPRGGLVIVVEGVGSRRPFVKVVERIPLPVQLRDEQLREVVRRSPGKRDEPTLECVLVELIRDPGSSPCVEPWGMSFGVRGAFRPPAGSKKTDKKCRFEKIADVLNGITWCQIAGLDDIADMDDGGSHSEDSHGNDGCLREAVAAAHGDNPENTDWQIGKPTSS